MSAVIPFDFEGQAVRALERRDGPWFVLVDVCRALGHSNPSMMARGLDEDEKDTLSSTEGIAAPQVKALIIINESGLYTLILRSRDATTRGTVAHRFRKWITSEVLPTLRRTGRYIMPGAGGSDTALDEVEASLARIREVRRTWGVRAAREVWHSLPGLPEIPLHLRGGQGVTLAQGPRPDHVERELEEAELFLSEATERQAEAKIPARRLYLAYCSWCADEGSTPMTETAFGRRLIELGEQRLKWGTRYWLGRRLRAGVGGEEEES